MEESKDLKNNSFESDLNRLKKIVETLENGNLSLEDSLNYFEEGIRMYRKCSTVLNNAEQKILLLLDDENREISFNMNGEK